ncbi:methyl-accepting chemotaxis protein [Frigidibacter sp.]|uniref:methyl-accepting chemotaxis protein n=1 Tax=Frigidibacter sp. TaxID=2586418 RepID=UPI0027363F24|nr:methyl-accepting chemotaxis protein [Frigidibacter sp.]MDP3339986.1 methyl-accepting chemotaxis protein [Frigidibacter sp.]
MARSQDPARGGRYLPRSVFAKTAMLFAICVTLIIVTMAVLDARTTERTAQDGVEKYAGLIVDMLGHEAGAGIQFKNTEAVTELFRRVLEESPETVLSLAAYDLQGQMFTQVGQEPNAAMAAAAVEAMSADHVYSTGDHRTFAHPAFFGKDRVVTGAVVIYADDSLAATLVRDIHIRSYLTGGVLLLVSLLAMSMPFRRMVSRPLVAVNGAMQRVAGGDYAVEVPALNRHDEIGAIAQSLETFRNSLQNAAETTRIGLFKGAAYEGCSASLMICDTDMKILFVNPAALTMMAEHEGAIRARVQSFDPRSLVGRNMDEFHAGNPTARRRLADLSALPLRAELNFGRANLVIEVNAVRGTDGSHIGFVVEWKDLSVELRNAAVLEAIDASQLRAEFTPMGQLESANATFYRALGRSAEQLQGVDLRSNIHVEGFDTSEKMLQALSQGQSVTGQIRLERPDGGEVILDGSFGVVRDRKNQVRSLILLGTDVTATETAKAASELARSQMEAAQHRVVEALRLGLEQLAAGDLTTKLSEPFTEEYERLRAYFNEATDQLRAAMQGVVENAEAIRGEAGEISSAADDLSRRTEQQAATLEQTAAALDQLTSSVKSAAEVAGQANRMVSEAKANAEMSGNVVREAVVAMGEIEESSGKISRITSVIDEIAFQTNLLALNAGVEAARAGEAGRGFAVVASEVRALAQRSSEAAREIAGLISASSHQVKRGVDLVGQAGQALGGIETSVADIYSCVSDIAVSSREQSSGLAEINIAVNQLDQVTQQNAAMFEQTTAASHSLNREAEALTATMGRFRTGAAGSGAPARPAARPQAAPARTASKPAPRPAPPKVAIASGGGRRLTALAVKPAPSNDDWEDF